MSSFDINSTENDNADYLEVDAPIPGQNFCCLSFISPEKVLVQKESFYIKEFLKSLQSNASINTESTEPGEESKTSDEITINISKVDTLYDDFMFINQQKLDEEFHKSNDFRTSVRGVKVRGVYNSY